jgi:phosphohistidine phosphatase SixA
MLSLNPRWILLVSCLGLLLADPPSAVSAEPQAGQELARALGSGGYVIVMRHAASPREVPDAANAAQGNQSRERQLDAAGIRAATAMGVALKGLKIPIGEVWSSPTFRARQTATYAALPEPRLAEALGDGGESMSAVGAKPADWLRSKANQAPHGGTNTVLITHFPNLRSAFGDLATGLADGEALIFRPENSGGPRLLGRIKIEEWPKFEY